jgi:hypothetical protein
MSTYFTLGNPSIEKLEIPRVKLSNVCLRTAKDMKDYVLLQEMACLG